MGPTVERYTYDTRGLMVQAQANGKNVYNTYDGDGRRIARRVADSLNPADPTTDKATDVSHYQYDGMFVVAMRDAAEALKMAYSRLPGGRLVTWFTWVRDFTARTRDGSLRRIRTGGVLGRPGRRTCTPMSGITR